MVRCAFLAIVIVPFVITGLMRHPTSAANRIIHQGALPLDPGVYRFGFQKEQQKRATPSAAPPEADVSLGLLSSIALSYISAK